MGLEQLSEAIDDLFSDEATTVVDGELVVSLHRELSRLRCLVAKTCAAFEAGSSWQLEGAQGAVPWITARCRVPVGEARRELREGRALRELPGFEARFSAGEVGAAQVDLVARLLRPATRSGVIEAEQMLLEQASTLSFSSFEQALSYFEQLVDAGGTEGRAQERRDRRDVVLSKSFGGTWLGKMTLDEISGEIVSSELRRLETELFEHDWHEAREHLGREPRVHELDRIASMRRADALVEMARRSLAMPAGSRRPEPLFSVLVDFPSLSGRICELASGQVVTPGSLLPYLETSIVERAVFGPARRVEVSETARLFSGATRRAIELRDRCCSHPYCERPASSCQVDHIVPFARGGLTTQENGRLLCGFHNRLRNTKPDSTGPNSTGPRAGQPAGRSSPEGPSPGG